MTGVTPLDLRWREYVLERGGRLHDLWSEHFEPGESNVLFVMGHSFDPRTCIALSELLTHGQLTRCDCDLLEIKDGGHATKKDLTNMAKANAATINSLLQGKGQVTLHQLDTFTTDGRRVLSSNAEAYAASLKFDGYTDVVVDVSGMPRSVFFPLLARMIYRLDNNVDAKSPPNLFVVVAEDPECDDAIRHEEVEEFANFLPKFSGGFDRVATDNLPKVWIPILGEDRQFHLERLYELIKPDEICPVLPSPARNPRRGDNLILEYHRFLFEEHQLDTRSFLFASDYRDTLRPLGGCKVAISALSSKLMSLGALLAAYDLKTVEMGVGVAHVECNSYHLDQIETASEVFGLWLTGRCYETE